MIRMVAGWVLRLAGGRLTERAARVVAVVSLVVLAVSLAGVAKCAYDGSIIERHDAERNREIAEDTVKADRKANNEAEARRLKFEAEQRRIEEATRNAIENDPDGGKRPVGDIDQSYFDSLPRKR